MSEDDKKLIIDAFTQAMKDLRIDYCYKYEASWEDAFIDCSQAIETFSNIINNIKESN